MINYFTKAIRVVMSLKVTHIAVTVEILWITRMAYKRVVTDKSPKLGVLIPAAIILKAAIFIKLFPGKAPDRVANVLVS